MGRRRSNDKCFVGSRPQAYNCWVEPYQVKIQIGLVLNPMIHQVINGQLVGYILDVV
jgi:hypothetical protein